MLQVQEELGVIVICKELYNYQKTTVPTYSDLQTDNLAKLGVAPGPPVPSAKEKCTTWLQGAGKELVEHDAIWGGAIHFVKAK